MRFVNRNAIDEPPSIKDPSDAVAMEKNAAIAFYSTYNARLTPRPKGFDFLEYKGFDVTSALRNLFCNKCAYCESDLGDVLEVEHFRPKGRVTEDPGHTGYWWLAHSWTNLLPSCIPCNQKRRQHLVTENMTIEEFSGLQATKAKVAYGKANQFPIEGTRATYPSSSCAHEEPLLIDPTIEDPEPYLKWSTGQYSVVLSKSRVPENEKRALSTISVFALNRVRLVQSRTRILNELRYQAEEIIQELEEDKAKGGSQSHLDRALKRVAAMRRLHAPEQPYSAMVKAFIDHFALDLRKRIELEI